MTLSRKTTRAAISALREQLKALAWDANAADKLRATYPEALRASKQRREIIAALYELEQTRTQS